MNYENDYIMRLIHEIIRTLIKLLLHIDTDSPMTEVELDASQSEMLDRWCGMMDDGNINEAENELILSLEDKSEKNLRTAILFYSYLNEKDDEFLNANNFSREEIRQGLQNLAERYGVRGIADIF